MRRIPCDVLVVGAGPAGIAASVAAARAGARTVLLEKYGFLGGLATAGMVGTICGLYVRRRSACAQHVCGGFAHEWAQRLRRMDCCDVAAMGNGLFVLPFEPWSFRRLADAAVRQAGVKTVLHATLSAVQTRAGRVVEASALVWDRVLVWRPGAVVDCTGEAVAVHLAGGKVYEPAAGQAPAIIFGMAPADRSVGALAERMSIHRRIARAVEAGRLGPACRHVSIVPAATGGAVLLKLSLAGNSRAGGAGITALEMRARELVDELCRFLPANCPALRKARLSQAPVQLGVRIGRRARGQASLSATDVLGCRKAADGVACGAWPVEEWGPDGRLRMRYLPEGGHYEIPLGCLTASGWDNLFVAGRCISASEKALASARVIGTAFATGFAAGTAAAFVATGRPLRQAVEEIRSQQVPGAAGPTE